MGKTIRLKGPRSIFTDDITEEAFGTKEEKADNRTAELTMETNKFAAGGRKTQLGPEKKYLTPSG